MTKLLTSYYSLILSFTHSFNKMEINNTSERRLTKAQFAGLFIGALALSCFAFTRSFRLQKEIPQEELNLLRDKQKVMESLAELSDLLRQYETEQLAGSLNAEMKEADVAEKMVTIRRQLLHKDTLTTYNDVGKLLDMAGQYRLFIKRTARDGDKKVKELEAQIAQLQQQNQMGELDKKSAQLQAQTAALQAAKSGGSAVANPAAVASTGQTVTIPPTNTGNANCDNQVNQIKTLYNRACSSMRPAIGQVRVDVNSISKGLFGKNSTEKQNIERNLQQIEKQLEALNN
jgi:surface antigen